MSTWSPNISLMVSVSISPSSTPYRSTSATRSEIKDWLYHALCFFCILVLFNVLPSMSSNETSSWGLGIALDRANKLNNNRYFITEKIKRNLPTLIFCLNYGFVSYLYPCKLSLKLLQICLGVFTYSVPLC